MIELLAPAKDKECAKAAIDFGADAIYIGANEFGARKNAPNSLEDIKEIVQYAHKFRVKVYITINTILTDKELIRARELIKKLEQIGVDAIIIQDMGLVRTTNLPIFASTQCDNRTAEKINFLENAGFSRVILARELSIEQIKEIRKQTKVELEAFIHGALCVSYSGQCYLSYAIGGRSANRGECAQPCRKKYSLVDEKGNFIAKDKYLLNLKDFNASKHIKELIEAGVTSFKIEGRLKDVNYVKNVVAYYRKLIDELGYKKTSSGKILLDFEPDLQKSFNRGFTDYFLEKRNECYCFDSPKSKGEYIGKVSKVGKNYFEFSSPFPLSSFLSPQDGLCFIDKNDFSGCLVNKVESHVMLNSIQHLISERPCDPDCRFDTLPCNPRSAQKQEELINLGRRIITRIYPNKMDGIKVGTEIYRNLNAEFEKKLNTSKTCRKMGVKIIFGLNKVSAVDEDDARAEINYEFEEFAQNQEKMRINIVNQLKKSGDSDFVVEEINIICDKIPFLPVSKLNELRRLLLEKLIKEKGKRKEEKENLSTYRLIDLSTYFQPSGFSAIDYRANVLNKSAKEFYEKHGFKVMEPAFESPLSKAGKTVMHCKHCLKYAFDLCPKTQSKHYPFDVVGLIGAPPSPHPPPQGARGADLSPTYFTNKNLFLVDEKGKRYELKFNCKKCEMEIVF